MTKIKLCPFCGGHGKLRKFDRAYGVKCARCGATGRWVYREEYLTICQTQNMAIKLWNTRVRDDDNDDSCTGSDIPNNRIHD